MSNGELYKGRDGLAGEIFLQKLIWGRLLWEDYRRVIRALAGQYLGNLDKTEERYE